MKKKNCFQMAVQKALTMTRNKALKLLENLGNSLQKEKDLEEAASVIFILAGTVALNNKEALLSLSHHNALWAAEAVRALQSQGEDGETPPSESPLILPDK